MSFSLFIIITVITSGRQSARDLFFVSRAERRPEEADASLLHPSEGKTGPRRGPRMRSS